MAKPVKYTFEELQNMVNESLLNEEMPNKLYNSVDGISKIIETIIKTNGENWAAHVVNNEGNPLLTKEEQLEFTEAFKPYLQTIIHFFNPDSIYYLEGGNLEEELLGFNPLKASGLTKLNYNSKLKSIKGNNPTQETGIDEYYNKLIKKIIDYDAIVKKFSSQHGITRLEKQHDLEEDVSIIPKKIRPTIATLTFAAAQIPPPVTQAFLSKIKVPFRLIVFIVYVLLDIARLSFGILNIEYMRKVLSIIVSSVEILRGDWKKALLSFLGYFGKTPMLFGEIAKVFIFIFQTLDPQLQMDLMYLPLDITKSIIIGFLISVFQVTAPEEIRLPVIGALENIAKMKANLDGKLIEAGMSARPDFFTISYDDLNNIQAIISDDTKVCSKEFQDAISLLKNIPILKIILQILRIPIDEETIQRKCGNIDTFTDELIKEQNELKQKGLINKSEEKIGGKRRVLRSILRRNTISS